MSKIAIIGGTGFSEYVEDAELVETDYGTIPVGKLELGGKEVDFVARHNELEVPPKVNYKRNIQALALEGVKIIYAVSASGRLSRDVLPGHLVAIDGLDWDDARILSFADVSGITLHAAMCPPISPYLHEKLTESWNHAEQKIKELYENSQKVSCGFHNSGTYFNIEGPAFSTPQKEERIRNTVKNAKIIGQTLAKEAHLAREMGIAFAGLAMCTDHSCHPLGEASVNHEKEVLGRIGLTSKAAYFLLEEAVRNTDLNYHEPVSHNTLVNLRMSQFDLEKLREKRPHLVEIIRREQSTISPRLAEDIRNAVYVTPPKNE